MSDSNSTTRKKMLNQWASAIAQHAQAGTLDRGRAVAIHAIEAVAGPRAGALEIHAGLDTGRLLTVLARNDCALHRQFVPWRFEGQPTVYLSSRYVRLEAGWPLDLAQADIPLDTLNRHPLGEGRWCAGMNESGGTVTVGLSHVAPHFLISGTTGSGKTWQMRSAMIQLSRDEMNEFILIDGKYGDGFMPLAGLPNLVGPVAITVEEAKSALGWAVAEMRRRYERHDTARRLVIAADEIQEFTGKAGDPAVIELTRKLLAQGRGANVHVILGTQHPTLDAFSDPAIKMNVTGRISGRVESYEASEAALGASSPRADTLMSGGDAYILTPLACRRAQLAYIPPSRLAGYCTAQPRLDVWPEFDAEAVQRMPDDAPRWNYSGDEMGAGLLNAAQDGGRPALVNLMGKCGMKRPGVSRAARLLALGREMRAWLEEHGACLSVRQESTDGAAGYIVADSGKIVSVPSKWTDRQEDETDDD